MGTYTDAYVEMLQQDLQHHYRKHFEISEELGEALMASEAKDEELTAAGQLLNLQMDATAQVEKKLVDALGVLSDRDIEIERLTFALKDKDYELESVRDEHRTQIDELMGKIERLTRKNKKTFRVAEVVTAQREMLATLDRRDGLISKAFACIDNHSDSIYKQQQSIDALLSAIENQPKTKDDLWTYIRRQMNQQGVGGNNEGEEAR